MPQDPKFEPLRFQPLSSDEQRAQSTAFLSRMRTRRLVEQFSSKPVPFELVSNAIAAAGTAPSMAIQQPWHFVVVADPAVKRRIREAAEAEEKENFDHRMRPDYLEALTQFGRSWRKPHLEDAPYLIVVFAQTYSVQSDPQTGNETKTPNFFVTEAVGFAIGILLCALHHAGLVTYIDTPSPMGFLNEILQRPSHERPYAILPVGYPTPDAQVAVVITKPVDDILTLVGDVTDQ